MVSSVQSRLLSLLLCWVQEFLGSKEYTFQINALKIAGVLFGFNQAFEEEELGK